VTNTAVNTVPANIFYGWTIMRLVLNRNTLSTIENGAFNGFAIGHSFTHSYSYYQKFCHMYSRFSMLKAISIFYEQQQSEVVHTG
jgi:hypothetical protein